MKTLLNMYQQLEKLAALKDAMLIYLPLLLCSQMTND